jgi:hypothetical protein
MIYPQIVPTEQNHNLPNGPSENTNSGGKRWNADFYDTYDLLWLPKRLMYFIL